MDFKLGYGTLGLLALILCAGMIWYNIENAPLEVPPVIEFSPPPVIDPYPELVENKVPVNSASIEELEQLPGIGPVRAEAIHTYVQSHGRFTKLEQLLEVEGIGEETLSSIRRYITLD